MLYFKAAAIAYAIIIIIVAIAAIVLFIEGLWNIYRQNRKSCTPRCTPMWRQQIMEITYEINVEAESMPVRGHYMEDALLARLDREEVEAWCVVKCTARIGEFEYTEYLGGCSLNDEYTAEVCVEEHGMKEEARIGLLTKIKNIHRESEDILNAFSKEFVP